MNRLSLRDNDVETDGVTVPSVHIYAVVAVE